MNPIYIPVSVEQELPKDEGRYFTNLGYLKFIPNDKSFLGEHASYDHVTPLWWLKPITSLSELPEEWKEAIREIAGDSFEDGASTSRNTESDVQTMKRKQEHLNSILK